MIRSTPMINTARLTLCAMRPEDFDRFAEIWASPVAWQHAGFRVRPTKYFMVGRFFSKRHQARWLRENWTYTLGDTDLV